MAAIVRTAQRDLWRERLGARVTAVISNRAQAPGLALAREQSVTTHVVDHRAFEVREAFDAALSAQIDAYDESGQPVLVVLAGFMRILTPAFVAHYTGRLLNIHPSLLPAFPGFLDAGCRFTGATVHRVTAELDHGPILAQAVVPVLPGDTPERLAERVLSQEHLLYPAAIVDLLRAT